MSGEIWEWTLRDILDLLGVPNVCRTLCRWSYISLGALSVRFPSRHLRPPTSYYIPHNVNILPKYMHSKFANNRTSLSDLQHFSMSDVLVPDTTSESPFNNLNTTRLVSRLHSVLYNIVAFAAVSTIEKYTV